MSRQYYSIPSGHRMKSENDISPFPLFDFVIYLDTYKSKPNKKDEPEKIHRQHFQILKTDIPELIQELIKLQND